MPAWEKYKFGLCLLLGSVLAAVAMPKSVEAAQPAVHQLEQIVVTARRRKENLQNVPVAVTAFTSQTIQDAGIKSVDDAVQLAPNIDIRDDQQPGVYTLTVRGVSTVRNGQPPVAFVVDGVTLPSSNDLTRELYDIQQIQILKGPQGALYGRNSIGGAIVITTKQPDNTFRGHLKVDVGEGYNESLSGSVSGPIVKDKLLFRLSGLRHTWDGLLHNITTGKNPDWLKTTALRGKVLWRPTDDLTVDFRASTYINHSGSAYYVPLGIAAPLGPALPLNTRVGVIQGDMPGVAHVNSSDFSLKIDWQTGIGTLTSITSYDKLKETNDQEIDWTPSSFLEGHLLTDSKGVTQEIRLTSPDDQRLRWLGGVFYQDTDRARGTVADINLNAFSGDLNPADKILAKVSDTLEKQNWRSEAVFGQINYGLTDKMDLTVALRYDRFQDKESQYIFGIKQPNVSKVFEAWQPKFSLSYKWTNDIMSYLSVARGWRPGGFNLPNILNSDSYKAETLWNYEVGIKSSFFGDRVRFNTSAFYIDYNNQQFFLLTSNASGGPVQLLVNGHKSRILGFDMQLTAQVTDRLQLIAGFGYTDATLRSAGPVITTPFPLTKPGNKLPNTADQTANISVQYTRPLWNDVNLIGRVDYSRLGTTYWTLDNVLKEKPYNLVNARLSLDWKHWELSAVVKNLFNAHYYSQVFDHRWSGFVTDIGWPSRPRYYGLEARVDF